MKKHLLAIVSLTAVSLAACGGSSGGSSLQNEVSKAFLASADNGDTPFTVDAKLSDCVAAAVLDVASYKSTLQKGLDKGLTGQKLLDTVGGDSADQDLFKATIGCLGSAQLVDIIVGEVKDPASMTDEKRQCLTDKFDEMKDDELVSGFIGFATDKKDAPGATEILSSTIACFGADAFG